MNAPAIINYMRSESQSKGMTQFWLMNAAITIKDIEWIFSHESPREQQSICMMRLLGIIFSPFSTTLMQLEF